MQSKIAVLITTKGRPGLVADLIARMNAQSRRPDHIFLVGSHPDDLTGFDAQGPGLTCILGRRGRAARLNDAIAAAGGDFDVLVFFDDDFLPSRYWIEQAVNLLATSPEIIGVTGQIVAGGVDTHGASSVDAQTIVDLRDGFPVEGRGLDFSHGLLGCNMAVKRAAVGGIWLDETLPVGSWLADADFCARIARRGRVGRAPQLFGVKMEHKTRREDGRTIGRAQIANAVYLARKGSFSFGFAAKFMAKNLFVNAARALFPEPYIDRAGRLVGNFQGLASLAHKQVAPQDMAEFRATPYPNQRRPASRDKARDAGRDSGSAIIQHHHY